MKTKTALTPFFITAGLMKKQRRHGCRSALRLVRGQRQDVFRSTMAGI
ncbi:MAG TPA: hypothetical protein PLZ38_07720 [Spirochaetota bacterium]|nr:hypothetical protein [Spirochaetota bacterium]